MTSQPFRLLPSQFARSGAHAGGQVPRSQRPPAAQAAPHAPQFKRSSVRSVSQPLAALPSQLPKPARQAPRAQAPPTQAEAALGFPIDIIGGHEEARLIYLGVSHVLPASREARLVIDIGGRSTEMILGHGRTPQRTESFGVGSASSGGARRSCGPCAVSRCRSSVW